MTKDKDDSHTRAVRDIDCDEVMRQLFDFLDGEVNVAAHDEIHQHIEDCRSCFSRVEFERQLKSRVQGAGKGAAPGSLHRRVADLMKDLGIGDGDEPGTSKD